MSYDATLGYTNAMQIKRIFALIIHPIKAVKLSRLDSREFFNLLILVLLKSFSLYHSVQNRRLYTFLLKEESMTYLIDFKVTRARFGQ